MTPNENVNITDIKPMAIDATATDLDILKFLVHKAPAMKKGMNTAVLNQLNIYSLNGKAPANNDTMTAPQNTFNVDPTSPQIA